MTAVQLLASAIVMLSATSANARPAGLTFERIGVPMTFDSLRGALLAPDVATRIPATIALARLGCGHNSFCVATLTSSYGDVRHGAAKALGNCPTDSALSALKALLRHGEPDLQVQIVAAKVLCEAGDPDAIVLLDSLAAATYDRHARRYVCRSSARPRHPVSDVPRAYWDNYGPALGFLRDDVIGAELVRHGSERVRTFTDAEIDTFLCLLGTSKPFDRARRCTGDICDIALMFKGGPGLVFTTDGSTIVPNDPSHRGYHWTYWTDDPRLQGFLLRALSSAGKRL